MSLQSIRPRVIDIPWPSPDNTLGPGATEAPVRRVWRVRKLSATEQDKHPVITSLLTGEAVERVDADDLLAELAAHLVAVGEMSVEGVALEEVVAWLDGEVDLLELRVVYSEWLVAHVQLSDQDAPSSSGRSASASTSGASAAPVSAASGNGHAPTAPDTRTTTPDGLASVPSTSPAGS